MPCCAGCDEPAASYKPNQEEDGFDHKQDKFMVFCCCGPMHSTIATKILGLVIKVALWLGVYSAAGRKDLVIVIALLAQMGFVVGLLLGLMFRRSWLVVPFLGWMLIMLVGECFATLFCFGLAVIPYDQEILATLQTFQPGQATEIKTRLLLVFIGTSFIICTFIQYWFFSITQRCYTYLKQYAQFREEFKYTAAVLESRIENKP